MKIETIPVLGDNFAYLVICERTAQAAAVDPADARTVQRRAAALGVTISAIWTTHHHHDHSGGNLELASGGGVEVYGHHADGGKIPALTTALHHGDTLSLGDLSVRVIHTPGHTLGALCYLVEDALFTGDTLFGAGCGRLFEGDAPTMFRSLGRLAALPPESRVFFGHEYTLTNLGFAATLEPDNASLQQRLRRVEELPPPAHSVPSTLADELATNPFLRGESEQLRRSLQRQFSSDSWTPLQVFTRVRQLRNAW